MFSNANFLEMWEELYKSYSVARLCEEIELLHQFQHGLVLDLVEKRKGPAIVIMLITMSQIRENLILDMLVERYVNVTEKLNRQNESGTNKETGVPTDSKTE